MSEWQIADYTKNWTSNEWNNYGILTFADPNPHYPLAFCVGRDIVGTVETEGTYHGRGFTGLAGKLETGAGTYDVPEYVEGRKSVNNFDTGWFSRPSDSTEALRVLSFEARSSSETECLVIARRYAGYGNQDMYAYCDTLFQFDFPQFDDIKGFRIYVQASNRHANQTSGIAIYIWQYDLSAGDGSGEWEEIAGPGGGTLDPLTSVDADGTGRIWDVFNEFFELSDGSEGWNKLEKSSTNTWGYYVYDQYKQNQSSSDEEGDLVARGVRLKVQCLDDNDEDRGSGMNLGQVYIQAIRKGGETNQYPIIDTEPQALQTDVSSIMTYVLPGDFYVVAPSAQIIFDDMDNVSYGATDYSFTFTDDTVTDFFIGAEFYGLSHLSVLDILKEAGHYMWFYDSTTQSLHLKDRTDLTDTGLTFDSNILNTDNCQVSYPKRQVIDKIILKGNPTLDLSYSDSSPWSATNQSTQVYFESMPHITTKGELKKIADNLFLRYGDLFPVVVVSLPYVSEYSIIKIGTSIAVDYSTVDIADMRVQRILYKFEAGKGLYVTYYLGNPQSPDTIRIRDQINRQTRKISELFARTNYGDYTSSGVVHSSSGGGSGGDGFYYVQTDGTTPMSDDWDIGSHSIRAKHFRFDGSNEDPNSLTLDCILITGDYTIYFGGSGDTYVPQLTVNESNQLQKIGSATISEEQWGWLGGQDQSVDTASFVEFGKVSLIDDAVLAIGADDDFTIAHDGSDTNIANLVGDLIYDLSGSYIVQTSLNYIIHDVIDGVDLFDLDTQGRTLIIGAAADTLAMTFHGSITLDDVTVDSINEEVIDHNTLLNTHDLTTDIDHDMILNTHDLTLDIDHDSIANTHQGVDTTDSPSFVAATITAGNLLMSGSGTDDERLRMPYLTAIPTSVDNGSIWVEADGVHAYYGGAENILATGASGHTLDSGAHTDVVGIAEAKGMILWWDGTQWDAITPSGTVGWTLVCDNVDGTFSWQAAGGADNLGNHTATQHLNMAGYDIIGGTNIDTDSGTDKFHISRLGEATAQNMSCWMDDSNFYFNWEQDEASAHIVYFDSIGTQADYWQYLFQIGTDNHFGIDHNAITSYKTHAFTDMTGTGNITWTRTANNALTISYSSTEDCNLWIKGDSANDDETQHAWFSAYQDGTARWLHAGVGENFDDNNGFIASYGSSTEGLNLCVGASFPSTAVIMALKVGTTTVPYVTIPHGHTGTNWGMTQEIGLAVGVSGTTAGRIRLYGTTAGGGGSLQATTSNFHLDSITGAMYLNNYNAGIIYNRSVVNCNYYIESTGVPSDPGAASVRFGYGTNSFRAYTNYGYIDIGPQNATYCHMYTDRGSFYFNQSAYFVDSGESKIRVFGSAGDAWIGFGTAGSETHNVGVDSADVNYIFIGQGIRPSIGGAGILIDGSNPNGGPSIHAGSDINHTILLDPETDVIRIAPGDVSTDYHYRLYSNGTSALNTVFNVCNTAGSQVHKYGQLGTSSYAWSHMYCYSAWDDNGTLGNFDEHDDLALIDAIDVQYEAEFEKDSEGRPLRDDNNRGFRYKKDAQNEIQYKLDKDGKKIVFRDEEGNAVIDPSTLPEFLNKDGFSKPSNVAAFGLGAIKQLHQKVKDQENVIGLQGEKILELEARLNAL